MKFSIPVEIGFQVLNTFIKENIPYCKYDPGEENEAEVFCIGIDVDDDFSDRAKEIIKGVTGGQKTRSENFQ